MRSEYSMWLTGFFLTASALLFLLPVSVFAQPIVWYVNGINGNDSNSCQTAAAACKTIGHAISLASSGDSIIVAPATYRENLTIGINLSVIGSGASTTIIDGGGVSNVIIVSNTAADVTLSNLTIQNGVGVGLYRPGGGVLNGGKLKILTSVISGNRATTGVATWYALARGGGIANSGTLTIINSTVSGNSATRGCTAACIAWGGAIFNSGTLTIHNSTLSGNSAATGGAIFTEGSLTSINSSTLSGNSSAAGGGAIFIYGVHQVVLQNTIVANSINCTGTMISNGYNFSSDGTCNFNSRGDLNNHDPLLGPLQNNGGPTDTMALLPGSPAIDAGNPRGCTDDKGNLLTTDQRGMPRPDKEDQAGCDIGAFESQSD